MSSHHDNSFFAFCEGLLNGAYPLHIDKNEQNQSVQYKVLEKLQLLSLYRPSHMHEHHLSCGQVGRERSISGDETDHPKRTRHLIQEAYVRHISKNPNPNMLNANAGGGMGMTPNLLQMPPLDGGIGK